MKPHLSPSSINRYLGCGMQYFYSKVQGIVVPPGFAMVRGTGTHRSIEKNLQSKMETGELLPEEAVKDIARDAVNGVIEVEGVRVGPEEKGQEKALQGTAVDDAVALALLHYEKVAPLVEPVAIEEGFQIEADGFDYGLKGFIDIKEEGRILDTKTTGKTPGQDVVDRSRQLTAYAFARFAKEGVTGQQEVRLDNLVTTKTPKYVPLMSHRGPKDYETLLLTMQSVGTAIDAGVFMPCAEDSWRCSDKWCGYWKNTCPYGRRGRSRANG